MSGGGQGDCGGECGGGGGGEGLVGEGLGGAEGGEGESGGGESGVGLGGCGDGGGEAVAAAIEATPKESARASTGLTECWPRGVVFVYDLGVEHMCIELKV